MKNSLFTVYIEQDEDGIFVGSVPALPSCYAQGETQEEMIDNLRDVLKLCIRNIDSKILKKIKFVGIKNVKVTHA